MKLKLTVLIFALLAIGVNAQEVMQKEAVMSLGNQVAYVVDIEGADEGVAKDVWEKYLKDYGDVKRNKKAKEYFCEECKINMISSAPVQITMKIDERKDMSVVSAFFDSGEHFITSETDPDAAVIIEKFMYNYALEVKRTVIEKELEEAEKDLKDFNKDQEKLEKTNKGLHEDIEKYKKKIIEAEEDIEENLQEQEAKQIEIKNQTKMVEEISTRLNNVGK